MSYYLLALQKYATFSGRASRSEYWYFFLVNFLISITLGIMSMLVSDTLSILGTLYSLGVLIPSLALGSRRLHDIDKSGWMQLIMLIPIIGFIWLIVLFASKSSPEDNRYGSKSSVPQKV